MDKAKHTYFIAGTHNDAMTGYFKVGVSVSAPQRVREIRRQVPFDITPIFCLEHFDEKDTFIEQELLKEFDAERQPKSEWFWVPNRFADQNFVFAEPHQIECLAFVDEVINWVNHHMPRCRHVWLSIHPDFEHKLPQWEDEGIAP